MDKPKVIVIAGPTASGKTSLSIKLSKEINGEIISADSMQIYKEMNIGTAKPTKEECMQAVHHLVDFVPPDKRYSVADFKNDATEKIKDILSRGKNVIIVGGTGLYINSLVYNIEYNEEKTDLEYRKKLEEYSVEELYEKANKIDSKAVEKISKTDRKRLSRILEIYHTTGKTKTELEINSRKKLEYDYRIFVLSTDREKLYERINKRVDIMVEQGLIEEVKEILQKYDNMSTAMQGIGYKEVKEYLDGSVTKEEMLEKLKMETRRYAKRQLTWFRAYENAVWLDTFNPNNVDIILEELSEKANQ